VLVYTAYNSREEVQPFFDCGADSYVHKGESPARLREALRETCAGRQVWFLGEGTEKAYPSREPAARLTAREREVYELVMRGYSNARIAEDLNVSVSTVKTHVGHIFDKLGASCREDLLGSDPSARRRY
jgi:DNA-binding NarL/FixJ family response regulator